MTILAFVSFKDLIMGHKPPSGFAMKQTDLKYGIYLSKNTMHLTLIFATKKICLESQKFKNILLICKGKYSIVFYPPRCYTCAVVWLTGACA